MPRRRPAGVEPARVGHRQRDGVDEGARVGASAGPRRPARRGLPRRPRPRRSTQHAVADGADDRQVVADEGHGEAHVAGEIAEQVQHLGLGRDVEARDDLVGQHEVGLSASRRGRCRRAGAGRPRARAGSGRATRRRQPDAVEDRRQPRRSASRLVRRDAVQQQRRRRGCGRSVWRGLSEAIGSWKIICMRRRSGRMRGLVAGA